VLEADDVGGNEAPAKKHSGRHDPPLGLNILRREQRRDVGNGPPRILGVDLHGPAAGLFPAGQAGPHWVVGLALPKVAKANADGPPLHRSPPMRVC